MIRNSCRIPPVLDSSAPIVFCVFPSAHRRVRRIERRIRFGARSPCSNVVRYAARLTSQPASCRAVRKGLSARKNCIGPAMRCSRRLRANTEVGMEKMITARSADIPVSLRAAVRPTPVGATSRSAATVTELHGLQRMSAAPEPYALESARSMRLKATWMRTVDGALVCRWIGSAEAGAS